MTKYLLSLTITLLVTIVVFGQDGSYKNAIGVRLSSSIPTVKNGITYKHFLATMQ
ncbi:MAG: hypothetical protein IPP48_13635 [Chitinophagaceae bacterium]|nr:hypothetical protein [Chitinophagaceae bacterium]